MQWLRNHLPILALFNPNPKEAHRGDHLSKAGSYLVMSPKALHAGGKHQVGQWYTAGKTQELTSIKAKAIHMKDTLNLRETLQVTMKQDTLDMVP